MTKLTTDVDELVIDEASYFIDPVYEAGAFILEKDGEYKFIRLDNKWENTRIGYALYEPEDEDYVKHIAPLINKGWKMHSCLHTHPCFSAQYSQIDYNNLFQGFKYNYIKSVKNNQIIKWTWINDKELKGEIIF